MKQVEILEVIKEGYLVRHAGDIVTIDDSLADVYIANGLAKCIKTGECGDRKEGAAKVTINPLAIQVNAK